MFAEFDLVQVRNPWGSGEFSSGVWNDDGPVRTICASVRASFKQTHSSAPDGAYSLTHYAICVGMACLPRRQGSGWARSTRRWGVLDGEERILSQISRHLYIGAMNVQEWVATEN
jgi:hypothetical protein